jgi:DNA-binding beta-propeller fold protein YncE
LLLAHPGNGSLDVIDLDQRKLLKSVPTGAAQSSAVDAVNGHYLVGVSKPSQLAVVDAANLEVISKVPLTGSADLIAFNPKSAAAFVGHDDGKDLWVIDATQGKVAATIALPGEAPEDLGFDASFQKLIQSMKIGDLVAVIDLATNKVISTWPTAPAKAPHGMALVPEEHAFLVAGWRAATESWS